LNKSVITNSNIKETGELIGGYNPFYWNKNENSLNDSYHIGKDKSFIFKIDESQLDNSILSRVRNSRNVSSSDLALIININHEPCHYYQYDGFAFENDLNLRNSNKIVHLLEECEVYKVVKKN